MKIKLTSVLVDDQEKALKFYTEVLGFIKKTEIPMGKHKWLTVVSKEEQDGIELVLERISSNRQRFFKKSYIKLAFHLQHSMLTTWIRNMSDSQI